MLFIEKSELLCHHGLHRIHITHSPLCQGICSVYSPAVSNAAGPSKEGFPSSTRQQRWGHWLPLPRYPAPFLLQGVPQNYTSTFCQLRQSTRISILKTFTVFLNMLLTHCTIKFISSFLIKWTCIISLFCCSLCLYSHFHAFRPPYLLTVSRTQGNTTTHAKCISYASSEMSSLHLFLMCLTLSPVAYKANTIIDKILMFTWFKGLEFFISDVSSSSSIYYTDPYID